MQNTREFIKAFTADYLATGQTNDIEAAIKDMRRSMIYRAKLEDITEADLQEELVSISEYCASQLDQIWDRSVDNSY